MNEYEDLAWDLGYASVISDGVRHMPPTNSEVFREDYWLGARAALQDIEEEDYARDE